jgi:energy-coupling factor transporter transmembrane protein EcfT
MTVLRGLLHGLRRVLRGVLLALAAAILFIEEWGWRPLTACLAWLAKWPPLARLEAAIRGVSPRWALVLFIVPATLLFPIKLVALWFIHEGHAAWGLAVIVAAKLLGTALVGRLFVLTESQLMQFAWFVRALSWWRATKERVTAAVKGTASWRAAQVLMRRVRVLFRRFSR